MTKHTFEQIFKSVPEKAIAHIKTKHGDKICVKDNSKSESNKITTTLNDEYIEISSKNSSDKKVSVNCTYVAYDEIAQFEMLHSYKIE